jgi:hypothetical protein
MKRGLQCDRVVALLSPDYEGSKHCQAEWNAAYADDPDGSMRKLVPLLVRKTSLNFLARQVVYANLVDVPPDQFEERVLDAVRSGSAGIVPVSSVSSPVRHTWNEKAKLAVEGSALADLNVGRGAGDLTKLLKAARMLGTNLLERAEGPQFNYSKKYGECLQSYVEEIPSGTDDGNIFLADAMARTLRNLFAAEADILDSAFSSELQTFLECHFGVRPYYPELGEFYASVMDGMLVAPLDLDTVNELIASIVSHTPSQFDSSVSDVLNKEESSAPPVVREADAGPRRRSNATPEPPRDPLGNFSRQLSRDQLLARTVNGMWRTFLKGRDIVPEVEQWRRAYESMEPHVAVILDYLRKSLRDEQS